MPKQEQKPLEEASAAFGDSLGLLLSLRGMSQAGLGRELKKRSYTVSTKTINNIVKGRHPPELGNLSAIAEYFEVPLWVMFIPGLTKEVLQKPQLSRLVMMMANYLACEDPQRMLVEGVTAGYAGLKKPK